MLYAPSSATLATHALQLKSTWVLFAFFYTGSNDLMYFWACHVVNLRIMEGLFFSKQHG